MLELTFPAGPPQSPEDVLRRLTAPPSGGWLRVGDPRIVAFLTGLASRLLAPALVRRQPELGSLGYFLRPAELARLLDRVRAGTPPQAEAFPRGLVFHVPPANVDTLFVYSWAVSALMGNANVVRISPRAGAAARTLLDAMNAELATAHPAVAETQAMVGYGHDEDVTAALSRACDLRVVWGGDDTVVRLRGFPLAPHARDLGFPDRSSFAAIATRAWLDADAPTRQRVAEGLAADAFWFDQAACASPRTIFLVGTAADGAVVADELLDLVSAAADRRGWGTDPAMAVQRRVDTYGLAAEGAAASLRFAGTAVAGAVLTEGASLPRSWLGAGTLPLRTVDSLADIVPLVRRRDQTLTQFGFTDGELAAFTTDLGGRGIDRIVPIGAALTFAPVWDGYDLPREFTRLVIVAGS